MTKRWSVAHTNGTSPVPQEPDSLILKLFVFLLILTVSQAARTRLGHDSHILRTNLHPPCPVLSCPCPVLLICLLLRWICLFVSSCIQCPLPICCHLIRLLCPPACPHLLCLCLVSVLVLASCTIASFHIDETEQEAEPKQPEQQPPLATSAW